VAERDSAPRRFARSAPAPVPAKRFARKIGRGNVDTMVARQPWAELAPFLERAGIDVAKATNQLKAYTALLLNWNRDVSNLISTNDEHRFVERHLRESVEPAQWVQEARAARWIDFGSGGGLPALPLALCGIGESWTLVESRRTKTLFIRKAIQELGLSNIEVINDRLENVAEIPENASVFDAFTSRATLTLGPTLKLAAALVRPSGDAFLWKGSRHEQEMNDEPFWRSMWDLSAVLPIGSEQTVVCRFKKHTAN
jgi:16S rRNA (guanine527-N7)-methyltransferase